MEINVNEYNVAIEPIELTVELSTNTGGQGARGPRGTDGSVLEAIADGPLSGHKLVLYNSSHKFVYGDCTDIDHLNRIVGITTGASVDGAVSVAARTGLIEHNGWSWTPDQPIFLGQNGSPTQSLPGGAEFSQVIGIAVSATSISLNIMPGIVLA